MERRTGSILAWAMYDFANTIYSMNVVSLYFPLLIVLNLGYPDIYVSMANSISMLIVALLAPFLGQLSDSLGRRMPFLIIVTVVCCLATAVIGLLSKTGSSVFSLLLLFIAANVGYQLGWLVIQFSDMILR